LYVKLVFVLYLALDSAMTKLLVYSMFVCVCLCKRVYVLCFFVCVERFVCIVYGTDARR